MTFSTTYYDVTSQVGDDKSTSTKLARSWLKEKSFRCTRDQYQTGFSSGWLTYRYGQLLNILYQLGLKFTGDSDNDSGCDINDNSHSLGTGPEANPNLSYMDEDDRARRRPRMSNQQKPSRQPRI